MGNQFCVSLKKFILVGRPKCYLLAVAVEIMELLRREYTALDGVCLGKTDISRNKKENKCRNRRKKYRF